MSGQKGATLFWTITVTILGRLLVDYYRRAQQAEILPDRSASVCADRSTLISHHALCFWRAARVGAGAIALYCIAASPVSDVIEDHGVSYHQFADDAQLYIAMNAAETASTLDRIARCTATAAVNTQTMVPAQRSATELRQTRGRRIRHHSPVAVYCLCEICRYRRSSLSVKCTAKSLGVILDSYLNFDSHAKSVVPACSFHTRSAP